MLNRTFLRDAAAIAAVLAFLVAIGSAGAAAALLLDGVVALAAGTVSVLVTAHLLSRPTGRVIDLCIGD